jgi:pantoate--beta-alanine ligase
MRIVHTVADLRQHLRAFRHPAVVPTMGNLHAGHLALVRAAKPLGDLTVATIFVNR